jgi:hypothetical protein
MPGPCAAAVLAVAKQLNSRTSRRFIGIPFTGVPRTRKRPGSKHIWECSSLLSSALVGGVIAAKPANHGNEMPETTHCRWKLFLPGIPNNRHSLPDRFVQNAFGCDTMIQIRKIIQISMMPKMVTAVDMNQPPAGFAGLSSACSNLSASASIA